MGVIMFRLTIFTYTLALPLQGEGICGELIKAKPTHAEARGRGASQMRQTLKDGAMTAERFEN